MKRTSRDGKSIIMSFEKWFWGETDSARLIYLDRFSQSGKPLTGNVWSPSGLSRNLGTTWESPPDFILCVALKKKKKKIFLCLIFF